MTHNTSLSIVYIDTKMLFPFSICYIVVICNIVLSFRGGSIQRQSNIQISLEHDPKILKA